LTAVSTDALVMPPADLAAEIAEMRAFVAS
jgi:hypothetical protein